MLQMGNGGAHGGQYRTHGGRVECGSGVVQREWQGGALDLKSSGTGGNC